jgi:hypothetical protein
MYINLYPDIPHSLFGIYILIEQHFHVLLKFSLWHFNTQQISSQSLPVSCGCSEGRSKVHRMRARTSYTSLVYHQDGQLYVWSPPLLQHISRLSATTIHLANGLLHLSSALYSLQLDLPVHITMASVCTSSTTNHSLKCINFPHHSIPYVFIITLLHCTIRYLMTIWKSLLCVVFYSQSIWPTNPCRILSMMVSIHIFMLSWLSSWYGSLGPLNEEIKSNLEVYQIAFCKIFPNCTQFQSATRLSFCTYNVRYC